MSAAERFWSKVTEAPSDCWVWGAGTSRDGYGKFKASGRSWRAHRWSWEFFNGPIPAGLVIDHLCRNVLCVNPAHLEPVSHAENTRRGLHVALRETCKHGHPWTPENTVSKGRGARTCRECERQRLHRYYMRNRERVSAYNREYYLRRTRAAEGQEVSRAV